MSQDASQIKWLLERELPELEAAGILDKAVAERIRGYHEELAKHAPAEKSRLAQILTILLSVLGGLLIGLGVILLFAYNWDMFPRQIRLAVALLPLLVSGILGWFVLAREKGPGWREPVALVLGCSITVSTALVSQIYNIQGDFNDFMRLVIALAVPIIWLFRSVSLASAVVIMLASIAGYSGNDGVGPWIVLLNIAVCAALGGFLVWRQNCYKNNRAARCWLQLLSCIFAAESLAVVLAYESNLPCFNIGFNLLICVLLFWGLAVSRHDPRHPINPMLFFGFICQIICLFMWSTSAWFVRGHSSDINAFLIALEVLAGAAAIWCLWKRFDAIMFIAALFGALGALAWTGWSWLNWAVLAYWLAAGVAVIVIAQRRRNLLQSLMGLMMLFGLAVNRFVDNDMSILTRALGFIVCGVVTIAVAVVLIKRCNRRHEEVQV